MQANGKIEIAVIVLLAFVVAGVGFGSGFLIGRHFPAHRYERFGSTTYLLDSSTGKVCYLGAFAGPREGKDLSILGVPASLTDQPPPCEK